MTTTAYQNTPDNVSNPDSREARQWLVDIVTNGFEYRSEGAPGGHARMSFDTLQRELTSQFKRSTDRVKNLHSASAQDVAAFEQTRGVMMDTVHRFGNQETLFKGLNALSLLEKVATSTQLHNEAADQVSTRLNEGFKAFDDIRRFIDQVELARSEGQVLPRVYPGEEDSHGQSLRVCAALEELRPTRTGELLGSRVDTGQLAAVASNYLREFERKGAKEKANIRPLCDQVKAPERTSLLHRAAARIGESGLGTLRI